MRYESFLNYGTLFLSEEASDNPVVYKRYGSGSKSVRFGMSFTRPVNGVGRLNMYVKEDGLPFFPARDIFRILGVKGKVSQNLGRYHLTDEAAKARVLVGTNVNHTTDWVLTLTGVNRLILRLEMAEKAVPQWAKAFFGTEVLAMAVRESRLLAVYDRLEQRLGKVILEKDSLQMALESAQKQGDRAKERLFEVSQALSDEQLKAEILQQALDRAENVLRKVRNKTNNYCTKASKRKKQQQAAAQDNRSQSVR